MLKPFKLQLLVVASVLLVATPALVLISRSEPPRSAPAPAPEPAAAPTERALVAPRDMPPLVFASNRPGSYQLYAMEPGDGDAVRVTDELAMYPAWSPDGTELVFVGEAAGFTSRRLELSRIRPDGTIDSLLKGPQVPSHPAVRAPGDSVSYQSTLQEISGAAGVTGRSSIDTVEVGERRQRTIIRNRGAAYQPAWAPDGRRLAIVLGNASCRSERLCRQRLVLWHADEDAREALIGRGSAAAPAWSPDGSSIAFTWDRGDGPAVWILRVRDRKLRQLTSGTPADSEPTWSPDGRQIAFMRRCDIFVQALDERRARNLTRTRDACEISPAWRPGGES